MTIKIEMIDEEKEDSNQVVKQSEIYWQDFLEEQNYNRDVNKMCGICKDDQIAKYGRITIKCKGLLTAEEQLGKDIYSDLAKVYSEEDLRQLETIYSPYAYMEEYCDIKNKNKPTRMFQERWYQRLLSACSATSKVVRIGRRGGKTYALAQGIIHACEADLGSKKIGHRALLVSPLQVQTDEVITTIKALCAALPVNPIKSSKASPVHEILFTNGSILKGFTAATNGDAVRGQPADSIWLDECLSGNSLITMSDGVQRFIKDIKQGDIVKSFNEKTRNFNKSKVSVVKITGEKTVYKYYLENGKTLTCTPNHPVYTLRGFVEIAFAKEILCINNKKLEYSKIIYSEHKGIESVYNMTVEEDHTYIANDLITHNCDDLPATAIGAIGGILMDNPDVRIWKSGTPKGEKNLYLAAQDPGTKEFHYPSFVNPLYSDTMDEKTRAQMDEIQYIQEVQAIYGITSDGVFQTSFIQRASSKPKILTELDVLSARNSFIVILGVDWNHDKVGTRIVVTAYDKNDPQFYILEQAKVAVEGWTQQVAMEKIVELNRKYNCDHVFVDCGFGATQIGELRLYGEQAAVRGPKGHPDIKLIDVQGVDFGSSVEVTDPTSGQKFKQGLKQFAVQNTVQILEKDLLSLHPDHNSDIIKQMKNYIQKTRNLGRVTYGYTSKRIGDHDLDAMIIAFYGFKKLYSSVLGGAIESVGIRFGSLRERVSSNVQDAISNTDVSGLSYVPRVHRSSSSKKSININTLRNKYRR